MTKNRTKKFKLFVTSKKTELTTPHAQPPVPSTPPLNTMPYRKGAAKRARRKAAAHARDTRESSPQEAIPGLPNHVVIHHVLRSDTASPIINTAMRDTVFGVGLEMGDKTTLVAKLESLCADASSGYLDPIVLARLRAVSTAMRDAVDSTGIKMGEKTSALAAFLGYLDTLKHKLQKGRLDKSKVCEGAAQGGHFEKLRWARANGCPWYEDTCYWAVMNGHFEMLQWARANGCPWDKYTCCGAASWGHLEMLQWARANGCPWNEDTCNLAAKCGHLEVLQWLRANGCPWDVHTCRSAAICGQLEVLQ